MKCTRSRKCTPHCGTGPCENSQYPYQPEYRIGSKGFFVRPLVKVFQSRSAARTSGFRYWYQYGLSLLRTCSIRVIFPSLPDFSSSRHPIAIGMLRSCVPAWMTTPDAFAALYARFSSPISLAIGFST